MPGGAAAAGRGAAPRLSVEMAPIVEKQTRKARRQRQNSLNGTGLEEDELAELVFASKQHDAFEDVRHLPHKTSTRSPNLFRPTWGRYMPPPKTPHPPACRYQEDCDSPASSPVNDPETYDTLVQM